MSSRATWRKRVGGSDAPRNLTCHTARAKSASSLCLPLSAPLLPYPCVPGLTGTSAIGVLAKIESADSVEHLDEILDAGKSDCKRPARVMPSRRIMATMQGWAWLGHWLGRWAAAGTNLRGCRCGLPLGPTLADAKCRMGHAINFSWKHAVGSVMMVRSAHLHACPDQQTTSPLPT